MVFQPIFGRAFMPPFPDLGVAAFSPTDIAGLQLWLKADAGLWQDSVGGTPAVADADVVGAWADQSGSGNNATQATTSKKPLLKLAIQNGMPVVRFDGTDDYLQALFALVQPVTIFLVMRKRSTGTSRWFIDGATENACSLYISSSNQVRLYSGGALYGTLYYTNWKIVTLVVNGATSEMFANGSSFAAGAIGSVSPGGMTIGGIAPTGQLPTDVDFGEIVEYNSALSTANRQAVEAYLNTRFAIY